MKDFPWIVILAAAAIAAVGPHALRPLLRRAGALDVPNHRSLHEQATLRGGGTAPLLGLALGGMLAVPLLEAPQAFALSAVIGAGVATGIVGLLEDLRGLPVLARAAFQFLVGVAISGVLLYQFGGDLFWVPLAAVFFAANVNFTNFMDGVNAISGLHGLVVGASFAMVGFAHGLPWLLLSGLLVAVVFLAFLPWNLTPPGMFLGDVGSYLLGGAVAASAIGALVFGVAPLTVLAPLAIYWTDTVAALVRRGLRGERIFEAHRSHVFQRLTDTGLCHVSVAVLVAGLTLLCSAVAAFAIIGAIPDLVAGIGVSAICGFYLLLPRLRGESKQAYFGTEPGERQPIGGAR